MVGHRQKRARDDDDAIDATASSITRRRLHRDSTSGEYSIVAAGLLEKWAWGSMSSVAVQHIANLMRLAGQAESDVDDLASLGSYGINEGHVHRDLKSLSVHDINNDV